MSELADASTALLLAAPLADAREAACIDHLVGDGEPPERVLHVLFTGRPEGRVEQWDRHADDRPETVVVLSSQRPARDLEGTEVELVDRPGDLTDIGVAITERMADWSPDERTGLCLDSVTAQLQYAEEEQVYRFLRTLFEHLAEHDVRAHVHLNPAAHDDRTVATFETLVEAVVEIDGGGTTLRTA